MTQVPDPTQIVFQNMKRLRIMRGWSARELAERVTSAGHPVQRGVIVNREIRNRVENVPLHFVVVLASIFGVSLSDLMTEAEDCARCGGEPPAGFTCRACGAEGEAS